jgi:phage-related protein
LIDQLKNKNLSEEFRECFINLKNFINNKLNGIKEEAKNKIKKFNSKIPNFIDNFTNIIDSIMAINFGPYKENKIDICQHIMTFILKVKSGEIIIIEKNEKGEIIIKDIQQLLIVYLDMELNIEAGNTMEIVEYLLENGLKSIIISKINNNLISYANKKFEIIKSCYEPILEMIKQYFARFKEDISKFANKLTEKINEKIDYFDYFIKYINCIFQNKSLYEFYYIIEENILIHNDLKFLFLKE